MRLATTTWGAGDRVALLLHGMLGSAAQYWQLGPALATRGYRAVAVDLPGHGDSPPATTFQSVVDSVTETMGSHPDLAIGHSFGGAALPTFRPAKVVYVDIPFVSDAQPPDPVRLRRDLEAAKAGRTAESLRHTRPEWSEQDRIVEADAAQRFDVGTAVAVNLTYAAGPFPAPQTDVPSLLVRPEPSRYVSAARAAELRALGFEVRSVPGAGHCVWYGRVPEFLQVLDDWPTAA